MLMSHKTWVVNENDSGEFSDEFESKLPFYTSDSALTSLTQLHLKYSLFVMQTFFFSICLEKIFS